MRPRQRRRRGGVRQRRSGSRCRPRPTAAPISAAPIAASTKPTICVLRREPCGKAPSRTAAIGGIRVALRAGSKPARTVIRTPTPIATTAVRGANTSAASGRAKPRADISAFSPLARPTPAASPISDAPRPITNDSSSTERRTCRRDPPSVRSVANSRARCATVIERVLKITKAPTNNATPPKASRTILMSATALSVSAWSACACSAPVLTCAYAGTICCSSATSRSAGTPGLAATAIAS